ncbi:MAG: ABC transporter substrate-binding protein [Planctomycetota bacterium]|nr:ABC transporter substrate-binding protein [Planctomycetota bacterium]
MSDEEEPTSRRRLLLWLVRGLFIAAAAVGMLWLFLGYEPPEERRWPGREKVVFWHMWTSNWAEVVRRICDRFNDSQDRYEVVPLTVFGGSLKTLIATSGGDPPDCMAQWEAVIPAWAARGALTPLDTLMPAEEWRALRDRMYPAVRDIGMYQDHFYGLSTGMNVWAVYYRPEYFRQTGLDPDKFPETLEELDALSDRLFQYDKDGRITRIGFTPRWLVHYIATFGGSLYDPATRQITFTNPKNVEALEWITSRADRYGFERILQFESGLSTTMAASWPFISGAYAMVLDGQWRVEQLAKYAPELEYRVAPLPPPKGGKPLACWSNGNFTIIPSGARNKAGAWAFMRFWSGVDKPERAAEFYTWGGWLPITPDVAAAPRYQAYCATYPHFRAFLQIMASPNVQVTPPVPVQAYMMSRLTWAEDAALRRHLSPREALEQAARETQRELENMGIGREGNRKEMLNVK